MFDDEFSKALDAYEKKFNDGFPTFPMSGKPPNRVIEIIEECITKNKDVYELGYLLLSEDVVY